MNKKQIILLSLALILLASYYKKEEPTTVRTLDKKINIMNPINKEKQVLIPHVSSKTFPINNKRLEKSYKKFMTLKEKRLEGLDATQKEAYLKKLEKHPLVLQNPDLLIQLKEKIKTN